MHKQVMLSRKLLIKHYWFGIFHIFAVSCLSLPTLEIFPLYLHMRECSKLHFFLFLYSKSVRFLKMLNILLLSSIQQNFEVGMIWMSEWTWCRLYKMSNQSLAHGMSSNLKLSILDNMVRHVKLRAIKKSIIRKVKFKVDLI